MSATFRSASAHESAAMSEGCCPSCGTKLRPQLGKASGPEVLSSGTCARHGWFLLQNHAERGLLLFTKPDTRAA